MSHLVKTERVCVWVNEWVRRKSFIALYTRSSRRSILFIKFRSSHATNLKLKGVLNNLCSTAKKREKYVSHITHDERRHITTYNFTVHQQPQWSNNSSFPHSLLLLSLLYGGTAAVKVYKYVANSSQYENAQAAKI